MTKSIEISEEQDENGVAFWSVSDTSGLNDDLSADSEDDARSEADAMADDCEAEHGVRPAIEWV